MTVFEVAHSVTLKKISQSEYRKVIKSSNLIFQQTESVTFEDDKNDIMSENDETENIDESPTALLPTATSFSTQLLSDLSNLANKKKKHFPDTIKEYGLFVLLLGGNVLYNNLSKNLGLPSRSTELKYFASREDLDFREGVLRSEELLRYLIKHEYPMHGWGSEDATKNTPGVRYCPKTNRMVGLVGPLNEGTGFPDLSNFEFNTVEKAFEVYQSHSKAEYINVQMFQPLQSNSVPFVINMFGTDNRFTHVHVRNRWINTKNALEYLGITLHGKEVFNLVRMH